jgi:hypothetical protein
MHNHNEAICRWLRSDTKTREILKITNSKALLQAYNTIQYIARSKNLVNTKIILKKYDMVIARLQTSQLVIQTIYSCEAVEREVQANKRCDVFGCNGW